LEPDIQSAMATVILYAGIFFIISIIATSFILWFLSLVKKKSELLKYKKIIVHPGKFHGDDVLSVAMLKFFGFKGRVVRKTEKEITEEEFDNPRIIILDVGGRCDFTKSNFDHHHDKTLAATNVLLSHWLVDINVLDRDVRNNLNQFLQDISDVDCGVIPGGGAVTSFNGLVLAFNSFNTKDKTESEIAFHKAVGVVEQIFEEQWCRAVQSVEDRKCLGTLEVHSRYFLINPHGRPLIGWKEYALKNDLRYIIQDNSRGGVEIEGIDSEKYPVPVSDKQTFRHNTGFMAVYPDFETARSHAVEMMFTC